MEAKRQRRSISLGEKLKLLELLKTQKICEVSRNCKVNESTLRSLQRKEKQLRQYAANCSSGGMDRVSYITRDHLIDGMERALYEWCIKERQKHHSHSVTVICTKAKEIYDALREAEETHPADETDWIDYKHDRDFKASKGWFRKFRKRFNLEGQVCESDAVEDYKERFEALLTNGGYVPNQVFVATEMALRWKGMPQRCDIARSDRLGYRVCMDRVNLLMCGNASGDFAVKPLLVHRTESPQSMRSVNHDTLPILWRWRTTPAVTEENFHEWLHECFIPTVRDYLQIMEFPGKCMLLLDPDMERFVAAYSNYDKNFLHIECLPKHTKEALQPLRKTVVPVFQCRYYERMFLGFSESKAQKLVNAWRSYTILDAINVMQVVLDELPSHVWQVGWLALWSELEQIVPMENIDIPAILLDAVQRVRDAAKSLPGVGFDDMTDEDVTDMITINTKEASRYPLDEPKKRKREKSVCDDEDSSVVASTTKLIEGHEEWIEGEIGSMDHLIYELDENDEPSRSLSLKLVKNSQASRDAKNRSVDIFGSTSTSGKEEVPSPSRIRYHHPYTIPPSEHHLTPETSHTVRKLNRAFALSHELADLLRSVHHPNVDAIKFADGLEDLLKPYRNLKESLQQPSVKDYFARK